MAFKELMKRLNIGVIIVIALIAGIVASTLYYESDVGGKYTLYIPESKYYYDENAIEFEYGTFGVVKPIEAYHTGLGYMAITFGRVIKGPVDTTLKLTLYSSNPEMPGTDEYNFKLKVDKLGIIHDTTTHNMGGMKYIYECISACLAILAFAFLILYYRRAKWNSCDGRTVFNLITAFSLITLAIGFGLCILELQFSIVKYTLTPLTTLLVKNFHLPAIGLSIVGALASLSILANKKANGLIPLLLSIAGIVAMLMMPQSNDSFASTIDIVATSAIIFVMSHIVSTFICTCASGKHTPQYDKAFILLFSTTADDEIELCVDEAIEFYLDQKEEKQKSSFIASGKKAKMIKDMLVSKGIAETKIVVEPKSTNLEQSFIRTQRLISTNFSGAYATFVVPDYQVFETGNVASNMMITIEGMGANTKGKLASRTLNNLISVMTRNPILEIAMLIITIALPILLCMI